MIGVKEQVANELCYQVSEVVTSIATIVNCTIVIASSQDTLTTVTNNIIKTSH